MNTEGEPTVPVQRQAAGKKKKRPLLASFLSFLAPGIGQYYNDQWIKALLLLIAYFGLGIVAVYMMLQTTGILMLLVLALIWLYSIADAFLVARKINRAKV